MPGLVLMSFGLGCVTGVAMGTATYGVEPADAGVASAAVNTMQQVGGSLGTALLSTLAAGAAVCGGLLRSRAPRDLPPGEPEAAVSAQPAVTR